MFDYEDILDALQEGDAVLFLGPRLLRNVAGAPLEEDLYDALEARSTEHPFIRNLLAGRKSY